MKKLFFIIAFLNFINCKSDKPLNSNEKLFDPKDLSQLSIENVVNFWDNDSLLYGSNSFISCSDYLEGVELRSNKKGIGVAVFMSQLKAINCMEGRINTVANVIESGVSNQILIGKWWFTAGIPNAVFVNQWNTIVVVYYYHNDYEEVKTLLMETSAEIARRIDSLSK